MSDPLCHINSIFPALVEFFFRLRLFFLMFAPFAVPFLDSPKKVFFLFFSSSVRLFFFLVYVKDIWGFQEGFIGSRPLSLSLLSYSFF